MPTSLSVQVKVQIPQGMYQESLGNLHAQKGELIFPSSLWTPADNGRVRLYTCRAKLAGKREERRCGVTGSNAVKNSG